MTHNFTSNGLKHANRLLGYEAFNPEVWEAIGQYDRQGSRHQAFVAPEIDVTVEGAHVEKGEKIRIEESHKWPFRRAARLWYEACAKNSVIEGAFFSNPGGDYCKFPVAYSLLGITVYSVSTHISYHFSYHQFPSTDYLQSYICSVDPK